MTLLAFLGLKPKSVVNDNQAQATASRLAQKLKQGAYDEVDSYLTKSTDENRERLIYGFACDEHSVPIAAAWAQARSRSSLAHTVLGASLIVSGWKIRGDSYAKDVDEKAWKPFLENLERSEEPLHIAARLDEKTADPYAWLIHAELGGEASRAKVREYFTAATSRVPLHWPAHYKYFCVTAEKWGGSHKEMFTFAREASRRAPKGNILHCLIPLAYCEYVLAEGASKVKHINNRERAAEVVTSLRAWLDTETEELDTKLGRVAGGFADYALNHFAVACYLCGARKEAREIIEALRGEIETVPWAWMARGFRERLNPGFVYDRVQRELAMS